MQSQTSSGIEILGDISWGTHFCQFYETKDDLLEILVPYFKTGLNNKEFCFWIVSNPRLTVEEAKSAFEKIIPDLDKQLADGNIEIRNATEWYLEGEVFNLERVISAWDEKHKWALARGYTGMRASGDTLWLSPKNWKDFHIYEQKIEDFVTGLRITVLCTYSLEKCGAAEILDVVDAHQCTIARRKGKWEVIETANQIKTQRLRLIIDTIPALVWSALPDGSVDFINQRHREFTGLSLEDVRGWRWTAIVHPDDRNRVVDEWRMALETSNPVKSECRLRRANGDYCWLVVQTVPLHDESGTVVQWYGTKSDITELKQAEDTLRKSEDRIRLIIDTIPTMAWTVQPDGIVDFVNRRWLDYAGLSLEETQLQIINPEDFPRVMEKWQANRAAGKPSEDEMRLRRADGEYRWCLIRTAPLHDEQGNILKWYGVSIDIEDSKKLSDALRESEQRYLSLFQNMKEGVAYFRMLFENGKLKDAIYLEVNSAWENLTGLKNVIGRRVTEVLPGILETNTEFLEQSSRVALTGQSERFEAYSTVLNKWLSTSAYCPQKEHVIVVIDDITERKQAEEALRKSERVLREAESLAHTGGWEHDLVTGEFFSTDENLRLFFGDDRSKGASFEDYTQAIHPDDREFVIQRHAQLLAEGGPREIEYRVVWPDGNVHVLLAVATVVRDESGQAIRTYGTNLDITERKQAEDKLQLAYQSLSYHVENTPLAVIEFDKDLVVKRWSKRAEEIFGWKASEALGKNIYDDDFRIIYT